MKDLRPRESAKLFKECYQVRKGNVYYSSQLYTRSKRRINYCVEFLHNQFLEYGLVYCYLVHRNTLAGFAVIEQLKKFNDKLLYGKTINDNYHNVKVARQQNNHTVIVPVTNIMDKCVYIEINEPSSVNSVVCKPPNKEERD